jgi:hypothetical protein
MKFPDWWQTAILIAASWRTWQLIAHDEIADRFRRWALKIGRDWREGTPAPPGYRARWGKWLICPYCAGFWMALAWFAAYEIYPRGTIFVGLPLALSAGLIAIAKVLSPKERT